MSLKKVTENGLLDQRQTRVRETDQLTGRVLRLGSRFAYLVAQAVLVNSSDPAYLADEDDDRLVGTAFSFQVARGAQLAEHYSLDPSGFQA